MSTFEDREDVFEKKFVHDAELQFKAEARRNKLLGLWAAALMGKSASDAESYSKEVIAADFEESGDEDVFRKITGDLGDLATEETIRAQMQTLMSEAVQQIKEES